MINNDGLPVGGLSGESLKIKLGEISQRSVQSGDRMAASSPQTNREAGTKETSIFHFWHQLMHNNLRKKKQTTTIFRGNKYTYRSTAISTEQLDTA